MRILLSFIILFSFTGIAVSQWSSNPAINLEICNLTGEQTLPLVAPTSDGGCYISWFDNRNGSYAVYLQRLSPEGIKLFAQDGLLISSNPQNSSLVGYDLKVDANDNAILVFTDMRAGSDINPYAYKISPSGNFDWGPNGIGLTDSTNIFQANPKIAVTSDGNYVFTWMYISTPKKIAIQKLDQSGNKVWGSSPIKLSGSPPENYDWSGIIASDNGSVILLWSGYSGTFLNPQNYKLYTQKFSSAGTPVWNSTQDTVYSLGQVSGFYNPLIFPDGNNGALYCWHDDRDQNNLMSAHVQRFNSSGQRLFPLNGTELSTQSGRNNYNPVGAVNPVSNETFVFWSPSNSGQTLAGGLYGQKIDATGQRLWTDNGIEFKPMDNNTISDMGVYLKDTNVIVSFNESQFGSIVSLIKAFSTGPAGVTGWSGSILTASSNTSEKVGFNSNITEQGMSILTWSDRRSSSGGIYAQNINLNGTLGGGTGIIHQTNIPQDFRLFQNYPNPFNPVTIISFNIPKSSNVKLTISDVLGRSVAILIDEVLSAGSYNYQFSAGKFKLSSGIYYYTLQAEDFIETKQMMLLK
ncbi:T9SS type A sorting domain-containing protein [Ignavibacteria bacterium CHB1]|nr:MAG: T9SS C-terminal target domain-containing protein [Chlorobiota bacterium]MBV6399717.1 hypothetical protein [Ignavibacteria bacterium]MCC6885233.1 T9SS type A sorting domain-containing protein [Ignavibacteriales bacterium]MCE7953364.1 T9SS C-terminal target domain-containing protein [Chlorobi bacterium CHB7]MDL1887220.1 T9SS type A sorting domain-containing protein [Ignavibacteria bacterium CHB1]RIK47732.1 MAG: hypothetical protein DCC60_09800 [Ignavibacteriota bacterium]